jgi:hypothetical protein
VVDRFLLKLPDTRGNSHILSIEISLVVGEYAHGSALTRQENSRRFSITQITQNQG